MLWLVKVARDFSGEASQRIRNMLASMATFVRLTCICEENAKHAGKNFEILTILWIFRPFS